MRNVSNRYLLYNTNFGFVPFRIVHDKTFWRKKEIWLRIVNFVED